MKTTGFNAWDDEAKRLLESGARPHFAPDPVEIDMHRRILSAWRARVGDALEPHRLLVLGATPELADLGLDLGFEVLRIDASSAMFEAARLREEARDRRNEECVVGDWRDLGTLADNTVHAVLGDAALNNVSHEDMSRVLGELQRVLVAGGILSLKQIVLPTTLGRRLELEPVLAARRKGDLDWTAFRMLVRFWCFRLAAYDPKTHAFDATQVYRAVEEEHAKGTWDAEEYAHLSRSRSTMRHTIYPAPTQATVFRRAFGAVRLKPASDALHHKLFFPHYEVTNSRSYRGTLS